MQTDNGIVPLPSDSARSNGRPIFRATAKSMTAPWRRTLLLGVLLLSAAWLALSALSVSAQEASKLTVAQSNVRMDVTRDGFFETRTKTRTATGSMLVSNQGASPAAAITVAGFDSNVSLIAVTARDQAGSPPSDLQPDESVVLRVSFVWSNKSVDTGWLVVQSSPLSGSPATVPFQIREAVPAWVLVRGVLFSLLAAIAVIALVALSLLGRDNGVTTGATWTFKDS